MALNALTLSVSNGIQGKSFKSAVSGMTPGNLVEVMPGSAPGFGYSNGFLSNPSLSYDSNLAILRERNEVTGENRTTQLIITAISSYALLTQAGTIDATYRTYRTGAVKQGDGSEIWYIFVEGQTGATVSAAAGAAIVVSISGTPPAGIVSSAYSFTPTTANGSGTKAFALTGSLPAGLTFSTTTGAITGTPTTVQTASGLNITVTDSSGSAALGVFSIAITAALSISGTPGTATIGSAYSFTPTAAGGAGTKVFSYSGTALAGYGLSFNTTTGAITGTVSGSVGTISGTITVADASGSANLPISISVAAAGATFAIGAQPLAGRIYQRSTRSGGGPGKGAGTIRHPITVTGAGAIYARILASDGVTVLQTIGLVSANVLTSATFIDIPGVDAAARDIRISLSGDGATWQNDTVNIAMGRLLAIHGQSMLVRWLNAFTDVTTLATLGITPTPYGRIFATWSESGHGTYQPAIGSMSWQAPADGGNFTSAGVASCLNYEVAASGVAVGVIGHAVGATDSAYWSVGGAGNTQFRAVTAAAGGAWEADLYFQGHSDSVLAKTSSQFQTALTNIFGDVDSRNSFSGYEKYVATYVWLSSLSWGGRAEVYAIRKGAYDWAAANSATYISCDDVKTNEGVHPGQLGSVTVSQHIARATRSALGLAGTDLGPAFGTPSRVTTHISIPVTLQSGATAATATSITNLFRAYKSGDVTYNIPITNATYTAGTLSLTLKGDMGVGQAIDVYYNFNPNITDGVDGSAHQIRDNHIESDEAAFTGNLAYVGRAMAASTAPLVVPAPTPGGATSPIPAYDLTLTSAAFATGKFGNAMSAGRGSVAGVPVPALMTIEAWVLFPSAPGSTAVIAGFGQSGWMGVDATGHLTTSSTPIGSLTSTATITDNAWHHVALSIGATQSCLFIDGVIAATFNGAAALRTGGDDTLCVRNLNGSFIPATGVLLDEVAVWNFRKYSAGFTPPASAYAGNEAGLVVLYHCDSDGTDAATTLK
jgi:hypothetical protein